MLFPICNQVAKRYTFASFFDPPVFRDFFSGGLEKKVTNKLATAGRRQAYQVVARQALVVLVAVIIITAGWGWQAGFSALMGAIICVLPNLIFARIAFSQAGARAARQVVYGFYKGEAAKLGLTILLFVIVLKWAPIHVGALFAAYGVGIVAQWLAPVLIQRK